MLTVHGVVAIVLQFECCGVDAKEILLDMDDNDLHDSEADDERHATELLIRGSEEESIVNKADRVGFVWEC